MVKLIDIYEEMSSEKEFDIDFNSFGSSLSSVIKSELSDNEEDIKKLESGRVEEAVVTSILGYILLSNTVVSMLSKFAKKMFAKYDFGKGYEAAQKIDDFAHNNERAFQAPIRRIISLFTKDQKKIDKIAESLYALVILFMAGQAGGSAVNALSKSSWIKGGLYGLKTAIKGTEVGIIVRNVLGGI
tara:strand:+ start:45 stop:602 length:558 start_codon:yes stop_codon:yes gene_type:complete